MHHGPVASIKHALERLLVHAAGLGRLAGMRVDPDASKLLRSMPSVDHFVEELGHSHVVEPNRDDAAELPNHSNVFDVEQVAQRSQTKATDLGRAAVSEEEQFGPGGWAKP